MAKALKDKKFVITGTLSIPRAQAVKVIERHGGRVTSVISGQTDYLVVGKMDKKATAKVKEAKKAGNKVKVIKESKLVQMIGS